MKDKPMVTEAMIEAGRKAYSLAAFAAPQDGPYSQTPDEYQGAMLSAIYRAMEAARPLADGLTRFAGLRRAIHELRLSAGVFRDYGYQHQDKADASTTTQDRLDRERKAKRNLDRATACQEALNAFDEAGGIEAIEQALQHKEVAERERDAAFHDIDRLRACANGEANQVEALQARLETQERALRKIADDPYPYGQRVQAMKKIAQEALNGERM